nr:Chain A, brevunsin [Brevundimonas diminuta]
DGMGEEFIEGLVRDSLYPPAG